MGTSDSPSGFVRVFLDHGQDRTLFLLHGTGGDEHDLIPLVEPLKEEFNFVGLRGNVSENGMPRFFARLKAGVFDQQSLATETAKLAGFLNAWYEQYDVQAGQAAFVGYSNGANMILATLLRHPEVISAGALLHPMLPFEPPDVDLTNKHFLVTQGLFDSMIPTGEANRVIAVLETRGAQVHSFSHPGGHELNREEQTALLEFLSAL